MKKTPATKPHDELRPEYDVRKLAGGVRGKYHARATAGTNLVLIDSDLSRIFPTSEAVNRALRVVAEAAQAAAPKRRAPANRP